MLKIRFENKFYFLAILMSILILNLKNKMNMEILSIYLITSLLGLKTIGCFISGNCYREVWVFILIYIFINIIFVGYYGEFKRELPNITKELEKKKLENNNINVKLIKNTLLNSDLLSKIKIKKLK